MTTAARIYVNPPKIPRNEKKKKINEKHLSRDVSRFYIYFRPKRITPAAAKICSIIASFYAIPVNNNVKSQNFYSL